MAGGNLIALPGDYSGGNPTMTALQQLLSGIGQTKGLQAMGVPKSKAGYISMLPEKLQAEAVKKLRAEQQMAALKQMYMQQQQQQQGGQQQVDPQTGQPIGQGDSVPSQQMGQQLAPQMGQQIDPSQQMPQQAGGQQGAVQPQGGGMMGGMASDPMGAALMTSMLPPEMQPAFTKGLASQQRETSANRALAEKMTKKYREDTSTEAKTAKDDLLAIKGQIDRVKSGKMMGRGSVIAVDILGNFLGLNETQKTAFKDDNSVIFEKYGIRYLRSLKDIFGARPTQWDAEQFQKGFPSLYQSKEGQEAILGDMRTAAKIKIQRNQIKDSITEQSGGFPPVNIESLVEKRLEPIQKKAWIKSREKMQAILNKDVPSAKTAKSFGKGKEITNKDGLVYVSDGTKWKVKFDFDKKS